MKATQLGISSSLTFVLVLCLFALPLGAFGKSANPDSENKQPYIVILDDPALAAYDGRLLSTPERDVSSTRLTATANQFTGASKLNVSSFESRQYLTFLDKRLDAFQAEVVLRLGRQLPTIRRYRNALNGFLTKLTDDEASVLRNMPRVESVQLDHVQHLLSDSGPKWIGADKIHHGSAGFPANGGQGVVAGVFDTGINWDHASFSDPGQGMAPGSGKWDHVNPYGRQLGLCSKAQVRCNDKLVGVYDFVSDRSATAVEEENTDGKDNAGHGSLVASVVAGNPGVDFAPFGGVAPNANIVSYRVCFVGDPNDPEDDGCQSSAILSAIDQAIADGVDVINHSIGDVASDPWSASSTSRAFLNLRSAGVFVATSAGNSGPGEGTVGSPANAPWITSIGAATHDRVFASVLENLSGGDTSPPSDLYGASLSGGIGVRKIVYAGDYGNALCGTGEAELQPGCSGNSGVQSNPFAPGTFHGEIVVCDRGIYGRVEKGKNLLRAGAGGYVLANTDDSPQTVVGDDHCLPATHLDREDGDKLRAWLATGGGHQGSISGSTLLHIAEAGDVMADFSSRGPNTPYATNVMKPDIIAPGVDIFGATSSTGEYGYANGTSFSSPHVAGAAALLKSVHPEWTPAMIASALILTATEEQVVDYDGSEADVHIRGAGRPRLDLAVNAGLFLDETSADFIAANPAFGGKTEELNLPGLVTTNCVGACGFERTVTDLVGGASWSASTEGLPDGLSVTVSPDSFTLSDGASQALNIDIAVEKAELVGRWLFGEVKLASGGHPDAVLPLAVYVSGGDLPDEWSIYTERNSGSREFTLEAEIDFPDATFTSAGLVVPDLTVRKLPQDPTDDDPYDDLTGVMNTWYNIPEGTLLFHTETLASSAVDLDLFVGFDANGNGAADEGEELCSSHTPTDIERCDLLAPSAGSYWVLVQNWKATNNLDDVTLKTAVVTDNALARLSASGNGIIPKNTSHKINVSWDNVGALPGTELIGAVGIGTHRNSPNNLGIVPVSFNKTAAALPETEILMNGLVRSFTLGAGVTHDRIAVDIPQGLESFTISTVATGDNGQHNESLELELYRMDFDSAFASAPFALPANISGAALAAASGSVDTGPTLTVTDDDLTAGRWYAVLKNTAVVDLTVEIKVELMSSAAPISLRGGLWQPSSRPDLNQGYDYSSTGGYRAFLWYTYDSKGQPAWYLAAGPEPDGNVWVADLERFTNDGSLQHSTSVGHVSVTALSETDNVFSFVLFGEQGSDRMMPSAAPVCPTVDGDKKSYTGLWSRQNAGVGGASVLATEVSQGYLHYIYDASGKPVWLLSAGNVDALPHTELPLLQFNGYCAVCEGSKPTNLEVGMFTMDFSNENGASWNLNYMLNTPLAGSITRSDGVAKLTVPISCQ